MKHTVTITQLADGLWNINQPWYEPKELFGHMSIAGKPYVDAYLITGKHKAVLIDCLMDYTDTPLPEIISSLTELPVEVYFTHGHFDHVGLETKNFIEAGYPLHLSHRDFETMLKIPEGFFGVQDWMVLSNFTDFKAGEVIDLGGTVLETFAVPGHTQGCICFLDRKNRRCFTGDAFGTVITGKNLILDGVTQLDDYLNNVAAFEDWVGDERCILYNGHLANVSFEPWTVGKLRERRLAFQKTAE